jgi:Tfp pilus assembly protein PilF
MSDDLNLSGAMRASTMLLEAGEYKKALKLLDEAIKAAIGTGENSSWIPTVCNHAAVVADFAGDHGLVKHYYEQSLTHDSENPRALYGLAKSYLELGDAQLAKSYATRCYESIKHGNHGKGGGLLDLIAKQWPELGAVGTVD